MKSMENARFKLALFLHVMQNGSSVARYNGYMEILGNSLDFLLYTGQTDCTPTWYSPELIADCKKI